MILRRLGNAIRTRNWFTEFIEFVIVVADNFVGLQAIAKILLMFMDIEDNTRRAARKQ